MKTVLIVEDEKMIRQGIRTMVQRCGVPVDNIIECSNGEMALDIVSEQTVDVMFTDIRMPKMDGIQLVKEIQKLDRKPEIVAISGFDDFSYAVEMLRNGVREYILKPVEREKITEIMRKLDAELQQKIEKYSTEKQLGIVQIKHLLGEEEPSEEELELLSGKYENVFFPQGYVVCVLGKDAVVKNQEGLMFVDDLDDANLCIVNAMDLSALLKNDLWNQFVGVSNPHSGVREVREAYLEARTARKVAFYSKTAVVYASDPLPRIPEGLKEQARRHLEESAWTQRLHLIGTDKTDKLGSLWNGLFIDLEKGNMVYEEFETGIRTFLIDMTGLYKNLIGDDESKKIAELGYIYNYTSIEAWEEGLMQLILGIHGAINEQPDNTKNQQKIKQAIAFIEANYDKDLNMAVVSNEISMNYSLFSFAFKQFTGSNFVTYLRDIRIAKAKKLLAETDMKIIEISQQVGYDNEKHFMKVFKSVCGVSPSEFRKNMTQ